MPLTYWKCPACDYKREIDAYDLLELSIDDVYCGNDQCPAKEGGLRGDLVRDVRLTLRIEHDPDPVDPIHGMSEGGRLVSFNSSHRAYANSSEFLSEDHEPGGSLWNEETQALMDQNLAFLLSYYEHSGCSWYRQGHGAPGTDCRWDESRFAGLLFLPTDISEEHREAASNHMLEDYSKWCNGSVYGYILEDEDGEHVDSCGGFYDWDHMLETIEVPEGAHVIIITGDSADFGDLEELNKEDSNEETEDCAHQWGPVEHARMTGNPHRKCLECGHITLDLLDDNEEEESEEEDCDPREVPLTQPLQFPPSPPTV